MAERGAGLTTLEGATLSSVSNASTTLLASGSNTAGAIIRHAQVTDGTNTASPGASLSIGGTVFLSVAGNNNGVPDNACTRDIFIPAGDAIAASSLNAANLVNVAWEAL